MIGISRGEPPKNNKLDSEKDDALNEIEELVKKGQLESKKFKRLWGETDVKEFLHKSQHGKCCYCERRRDKGDCDVEHFRPKSEVKEDDKHDGYWWLAYEWKNLLIVCKTCNRKKSSHFPLKDQNKRAYTKEGDIHNEKPFLINPLEEDPSNLINYDLPLDSNPIMIKAIGRCPRGQKTIELTGINSNQAMEERADRFEDFKNVKFIYDLMEEYGIDVSNQYKNKLQKNVRKYSSEKSTFSGFATFYFKKVGLLK